MSQCVEVPIGPRVLELLEIAYRSRRPVLLEGATGIGKSQIVAQLASQLGLDYLVLDLSLLEPPDLVGLPVIRENRTHYACPAELPVGGRGLLMLEELNRAEIPVMQPALQLLSARRLHSYQLPEGWSCVAAINPEDQDYQVHRMDPALRSRFLQLRVCAARASWLPWARQSNLHPAILHLVEQHQDAFEVVSPRSWAYASEVLQTMRAEELGDSELVRLVLSGYLPGPWTEVTLEALRAQPRLDLPSAEQLCHPDAPARLAELVASLAPDQVQALACHLRMQLARWPGDLELDSLERLVQPLPGDLREWCLEAVVQSPAAPALLRGLGLQPGELDQLAARVAEWREQLLVYRIQLAVAALLAWLPSQSQVEEVADGVLAVARQAGPPGEVLVRWLRARGLPSDA
ncbi:MAG: MoxR family ATPase [Vulcanimicrobiota bacterium]